MELLQLIYFRDAARSENFTVTAHKFIVPPSAVSQSIKRLEGELGVGLFVRHANRVSLSPEGRIFYESVSHALDTLEAARLRLSERSDSVSGNIRLLVRANRRGVTLAVDAFRREYPDVNFSIDHYAARDRWDYDLIVSDDIPDLAGMKKVLLCKERLMLAVAKENPCRIDTLWAARTADWVCMPKGTSLYRCIERACREAGFTPRITVQSDDPFYVRKYVELGMGVTLFPSYSWQGQFSDEVRVLDVGSIERKTYLFFTREEQALCVRLFAERLIKQFPKP